MGTPWVMAPASPRGLAGGPALWGGSWRSSADAPSLLPTGSGLAVLAYRDIDTVFCKESEAQASFGSFLQAPSGDTGLSAREGTVLGRREAQELLWSGD